ncbi:MAG TPA: hypothetical protein VK956_19155, partial [Verrucomicrobium sp.]|nr:hypothetical protein [Verrucomicrobium sp.]
GHGVGKDVLFHYPSFLAPLGCGATTPWYLKFVLQTTSSFPGAFTQGHFLFQKQKPRVFTHAGF